MRTITKLAICLALLLSVNKAHAQETFAPLISENCFLFIHVDLSNIDIDTIKNNLQQFGEDGLRELGFDEAAFAATTRELAVELDKLDSLVRPFWEALTKEIGITEFAIIADLGFLERGALVLVVPWKDKTDEQFETFYTLLTLSPDIMQNIDGFLFLPENSLMTEAVADWAKSITPVPADSPIHEALKSVAGADIKVAIALPEHLRQMAGPTLEMMGFPNEIRGLIQFASQRVQWASTSLSLPEILGGNGMSDVLLTLKTPRRTDAVMLRGMMEQAIEFGINTAQFAANMAANTQMQHEDFQIPPVVFSFAKGFLRALLPEVEDDKLVLRMKWELPELTRGETVAALGVGTVLLLPAVHAAREAAKRMQCVNQMRQIVIALHWYHDTYSALPPLHTVDANGKPLHSWRVLILPYIDEGALYEAIRLDEPWDSEHNRQFHDQMPSTFQCPSGSVVGCYYSVIAGKVYFEVITEPDGTRKFGGTPFVPAKEAGLRTGITFAGIADGTSNTLAIVEVREPLNWMDPTADVTLDELSKGVNVPEGRVGSNHPGGAGAVFLDASYRFLTESMGLDILRAGGTPAAGDDTRGWNW